MSGREASPGTATAEVHRLTDQLVALQAPPSEIGPWLRRLWDAGDAVLPLAPEASTAEVLRILDRLRPARLMAATPGGWRDEPLAAPLPIDDDLALVVATSGSTGEPKGVELTHGALAASTAASVRRLGCRDGETWLGCLPTHHVAGLQALLRSWALGTEPEVHDRFDVTEVAEAEAEHVSLVPTMLARLLDAEVDVGRFATVLLGGARPPADLLARAQQAGARVVLSYGMSETCGGCVYDGVPLDDVEVSTGPEGRIRLRGPMRFAGYRADEAATAAAIDEEGWFVSGDVGRWDGERLAVLGRVDDVVITGGENVPLAAVGAALRTHPQVRDAAATARDDEEWGQVVVAAVVPRDPVRAPSLEQLRTHVRREHPPAFAPREAVMVEAIPRDGLGKVTRATLDELVGGG